MHVCFTIVDFTFIFCIYTFSFAYLDANRSPYHSRIDPAKFMLSKEDRKMSAPVFPSNHQAVGVDDDHYLPRSPEVENIPEQLQEDQQESFLAG